MSKTNSAGVDMTKIHVFGMDSMICHFCGMHIDELPAGNVYADGRVCKRILQPVPLERDAGLEPAEINRAYLWQIIDVHSR